MLETERLDFEILNGHELKSYATNPVKFAKEYHFKTHEKKLSPELLDLINSSFLPNVNDPSKRYMFHTLW